MALPARKGYSGTGVSTTLTSSPGASDTTFTVAATTNWPTTYPFYVVVDPGTTKEEKMKVTGVSSLTVTVTRGQDGTTGVGHASGATCYPVFTALEADEANKIASVMTTKGDVISTDGTSINRLAVGTNTHVLQADSTATNGIKWGQVATAGIADSAITSAKILDGTIVLADLAASLQAFLVPVGTINAYAGATAPTGWLLCDGTAVSSSTYPSLYALVGGTTPDLKGKFLMGKTASGTGSSLLGAGGSTTIAEANLPSHSHGLNNHTHTIDHTHGTFTSTGSGSHNHGVAGIPTNTANHKYDNITGASYYTENSQNVLTDTVGNHQHDVTVSAYSGSSGGPSTASTTSTGSGTAYYQPFVAVSYIIKHD